MIGNSWVTTLRRASPGQGLEQVPALITASFSTILHLNWCESIISHLPKHKQLPLHLLTMHLQLWLVLRRHEVLQGKSFKDAGEFFFILAWLTHNLCVYTGLCQHRQFPAMKKKQKLQSAPGLAFTASFLLHCSQCISQPTVRAVVSFSVSTKTPRMEQISCYLLLCCITKLFSYSISFQHLTSTLPQGS